MCTRTLCIFAKSEVPVLGCMYTYCLTICQYRISKRIRKPLIVCYYSSMYVCLWRARIAIFPSRLNRFKMLLKEAYTLRCIFIIRTKKGQTPLIIQMPMGLRSDTFMDQFLSRREKTTTTLPTHK